MRRVLALTTAHVLASAAVPVLAEQAPPLENARTIQDNRATIIANAIRKAIAASRGSQR